MRKSLFYLASVMMIVSMLAACATPTPQIIVQTQVVKEVQTQVVKETSVVTVKETQVVKEVQTQVVEVTKEQPTVPPQPPTPTPYVRAAIQAGKVPIRWFVGVGTGTDAAQIKVEEQVVKDFNSAPDRAKDNIQLILEVIPNASSRDALATMMAASNGPDVIGPVGWAGSNAFYGQWLDIAPYMKDANYDTTQFDPALVKMYQTEEGQVGLPFAVYPSAIFFNTKLFDEAGLAYPPAKYGDKYKMPDGKEVEWSWDTVAAVAKLLTVDANGKNATDAAFDKTKVAQFGYSWQWEGTASYVGAFWQSGTLVAPGGAPGSFKAQIPDAWAAAWKWTYDGVWGAQPFIANGQLAGSPEFGSGNNFNSGKVAMIDQPVWYTCCMADLKNWDIAAMPTYNGKVGGRIDADTFRIWKYSKHPKEAFTVLSYLVGEGVQKLVVGSKDQPAAYGALPARAKDQGPFLDAKKAQFPWVKNWDTLIAGLAYPDAPSAEGYMPNWNEAWNRQQTFYNLMINTDKLDLSKEEATLKSDLEVIFNK